VLRDVTPEQHPRAVIRRLLKERLRLRRPERPRFSDHQHAARVEPIASALKVCEKLRDGARVDGRFFSERARRVAGDARADHPEPDFLVRRRDVPLQT